MENFLLRRCCVQDSFLLYSPVIFRNDKRSSVSHRCKRRNNCIVLLAGKKSNLK